MYIVKTKLVPPLLKPNVLARGRLKEVMLRNLDKRLILVIGGAGYGKTTLLVQLLESLNKKYLFYSLDKNDSSFKIFFSYLVEGVRQINKEFGKYMFSLIEEEKDWKVIVTTFINELLDNIKEELFIFLDDYHLIDNIKPITRAMEYFFTYFPSNIHFIISSRRIPSFSLVRLKAKNELMIISQDDLKFTDSEVQKIFERVYKLNLPPSILREIKSFANGWITLLQFISYKLKKTSQDSYNKLFFSPEIKDYFIYEVMNLQPQSIRSFLIQSSILEKMTPPSCNAILNREDSNKILKYLLDENLFLSSVDENTYVYHPVFREFLLAQAKKEKGWKSLHLRGAKYFRKIKDYKNSIKHYFLADRIKEAISLIEKEGENLISNRDLEGLKEMLSKVPKKFITKNPKLLFYWGRIFQWEGKLKESLNYYKKAKSIFTKKGQKREALKTKIQIIGITMLKGRYAYALRESKKILKEIQEQEDWLKLDALRLLFTNSYYIGDYKEAISFCREGLRLYKKVKNLYHEIVWKYNLLTYYIGIGEYEKVIQEGENIIKEERLSKVKIIGWIYGAIGYAYAVLGGFDRAEKLLKRGLKIVYFFGDKRGIISMFMTFGYLNFLKGKYKVCRIYFEKVRSLNQETKELLVEENALNYISKSYLKEGAVLEAHKWIEKLSSYSASSLLTRGLINLDLGNIRTTEEILLQLSKKLVKKGAIFEILSFHTLAARLYYKKWEKRKAIIHLTKALTLCKKYNLHILLLRDIGIEKLLLRFAQNENIEPSYTSFLIKELESQYDLIITLFGGLNIKQKGGEPVEIRWKTQKIKSLFCYLLVNRKKKFTPEQLIELLWPDKDFHKGQSNLHDALFFIRNKFSSLVPKNKPIIEYKDKGYQLNPNYKIWVDCEEFEKIIKDIEKYKRMDKKFFNLGLYQQVFTLYQGDFIEEIYDLWAEETRFFYKTQYKTLLHEFASFLQEGKRYKEAIRYSLKLISIDEFYDSAYFIAISSYLSIGNYRLATLLYKKLETLLQKELNLTPSSKIKNLLKKYSLI